MPTTRANLRTALQYHTDGKLTSSGDQDYYLNKAEMDVFAEWRKFDPGLFRDVRDSAATDSNGILLMDQEFARIELLEDANQREFLPLRDIRIASRGTGFFFVGYDTSSNKRKIRVIEAGNPVALTTLYWYNIRSLAMGAGDSAESAIPNEHRALISVRAAMLYYRDKGPAFIAAKNTWKQEFLEGVISAKEWYKKPSQQPQFIDSVDPDAGSPRQRLPGYIG